MTSAFDRNLGDVQEKVQLLAPELQSDLDELLLHRNSYTVFSDFMKMFETVVIDLQDDLSVTVSIIIPRIANLKRKLKASAAAGHSTLKGCLGMAALEALNMKISGMDATIPLAASYLDPFVKPQLIHVEKEWSFTKASENVRRLAQKYTDQCSNVNGPRECDFQVMQEDPFMQELTLYSSLYSVNQKVLRFWNDNQKNFPTLSQLAREIMSMPASSAPSDYCNRSTKQAIG